MTKIGARLAAVIVAAVAGIISYGHIRSVALSVGESELAGALLPIGVDGLIVVATLAMLEDARADRRPRLSARFALGCGVAFTIAGNIASAEPTWLARAVAAVPAISFLVAVEVLARVGKPRNVQIGKVRRAHFTSGKPATSGNALRATETRQNRSAGTGTTTKPRRKSTGDRVTAAAARMTDPTPAKLAAKLGVSERTVQRYLPPAPVESSPNGQLR